MTYTFPESLSALRKYLKSNGFEGDSVKTSRQAAFVAQQLLGTRVKFPPQGQDMTRVLMEIQKAVPAKGIATMATPQWDVHDTHTMRPKKPDQRSKKAVAKRKRQSLERKFSPETFAEGVHIFCDGCTEPNPGAGGWGVVVYLDGVESAFEFGGAAEITNNQMELTGLLNAINEAWKFVTDWGHATIWCDSQYCVKGVNEWRHGWKKNGWQRGGENAEPKNRVLANADLWQAIDAALENASISAHISVRWVKGHMGIAGNERADELAEMGRQEAIEMRSDLSTSSDDLDARYRQIMGAA